MASSSPASPSTCAAAAAAIEESSFEVDVSNDTFKFHAAHFVAFPGFRERLHGHTYRVGVKLFGKRGGKLRADGYLIDFGCVKSVTKAVCKRLNEHFICPMYSTVLNISQSPQPRTPNDNDDTGNGDNNNDDNDNDSAAASSVYIECTTDGSKFMFPRNDCAMLPLLHSTAEELAIYLWAEILRNLDHNYLLGRGIHTMKVTVTEAPGQSATFQMKIPTTTSTSDDVNHNTKQSAFALDVRQFILDGKIVPAPCLGGMINHNETSSASTTRSCPDCALNNGFKFDPNQSLAKEQLSRLAQAINDMQLQLPTSSASATSAVASSSSSTGTESCANASSGTKLLTVADLEKFL
jgi:dihydroneopterin triphosphate aldolase (PTPS-III) / 6-pyruvoyltetrahydropterin synthase